MFLESIFPLTIQNVKKDIFFTILRQAVLRCFSDADSLISPASGPLREREGKTAPDWLSRKWAGSVEPTGSVATAATPTVSGFRFPRPGTSSGVREPRLRVAHPSAADHQSRWCSSNGWVFIRRFLSALGPRFACRSALRRPLRCHLAGPACWDFRLAGVCAYNSGAGAFRYYEIRNCVSSKTAMSDFSSENRLRTRLVNGERSPSGPACDRESREVHWDPGRPRSRSEVTEAERGRSSRDGQPGVEPARTLPSPSIHFSLRGLPPLRPPLFLLSLPPPPRSELLPLLAPASGGTWRTPYYFSH